jgi:hypothetical protein
VGDDAAAAAPAGDAAARVWLLLAAYLLFRWSVAVIRLPEATPGGVVGVAFVLTAAGSLGLPIAAIGALVLALRSAPPRIGVALLGLVLWIGLVLAGSRVPAALHAPAAAVMDLGKILAAAGIGAALSAGIREPNILVPAGLFAAFADFVVVNFGTVHHALQSEKGQKVVEAVSAKVPAVHRALPALTIGPADFLFLGVFLACAARFGLGLERNAWLLAAVLTASLLLVPLIGAVPALAPMSLAFVIANRRAFKMSREEWVGSAAVLIVTGGLFLAYFLFLFPGKR